MGMGLVLPMHSYAEVAVARSKLIVQMWAQAG